VNLSGHVKLFLCLTKHHSVKTYPVLNWAPHHEDVWGSGDIAPCVPNVGTRCWWGVSFTPWPVYPRGKSPRYSLNGRLGSGGEEKNSSSAASAGNRTPVVQPVAWLLFWLAYPGHGLDSRSSIPARDTEFAFLHLVKTNFVSQPIGRPTYLPTYLTNQPTNHPSNHPSIQWNRMPYSWL
jgi:hypothetical protein